MSTKTLPTDKHGNVYYGPRTLREAEEAVSTGSSPDMVKRVCEDLRRAGFTWIASRVANQYL